MEPGTPNSSFILQFRERKTPEVTPIPEPTETPVPTATPTPSETPVPTATPTPEPAKVENGIYSGTAETGAQLCSK